jgi:hypothetical protein
MHSYFIIIFAALFVGSPVSAATKPLSQQQVIAFAKDATKETCNANNYKGCTFKASRAEGGWNVVASIIHSYDEQGKPLYMPEGYVFVIVNDDGTASKREGNSPVSRPLPSPQAFDRPIQCASKTSAIKIGMSRGEVSKLAEPDGGLAGTYQNERFYFPNIKSEGSSSDKVCMITVDLRPAILSAEIYNDPDRFAKWIEENKYKQQPSNVVVRVSEPYLDSIHFD